MTEDLWTTRCIPVLEAVAQAEEDGCEPGRAAREAWDARGLPDGAYMRTLVDLSDDGLLRSTNMGTFGDGHREVYVEGLTPRGRRAVGQWPGGSEAIGAILIDVLSRLESTESDPVRKSRLAALVCAVRELGLDFAAKTLGEVYAHTTGLP